jgi:hypothetical protein
METVADGAPLSAKAAATTLSICAISPAFNGAQTALELMARSEIIATANSERRAWTGVNAVRRFTYVIRYMATTK